MGSELGYRSRVVPDSSSVTFDDGMNHASAGWLISNDRQSVFAEEKSPGADAPRLASTAFFVYVVVQILFLIGLADPVLAWFFVVE